MIPGTLLRGLQVCDKHPLATGDEGLRQGLSIFPTRKDSEGELQLREAKLIPRGAKAQLQRTEVIIRQALPDSSNTVM